MTLIRVRCNLSFFIRYNWMGIIEILFNPKTNFVISFNPFDISPYIFYPCIESEKRKITMLRHLYPNFQKIAFFHRVYMRTKWEKIISFFPFFPFYFFPHVLCFLSLNPHQVHPCGRYRHNTVVFILAKEFNLKNLRTIHRLDRLTSGLLLFGRSPKKARQMEHQIRNRQVQKQYMCRVEGDFPE